MIEIEIFKSLRWSELNMYNDGLRARLPGFESRQKQNFLLSTASRPTLWPTQPLIKWIPVITSLGVKGPGHEANYSPPPSAEAKNCGAIPPLPNLTSWDSA
jgi:hypothetical protein